MESSTSDLASPFNAIWDDIASSGSFPEKRPLLAHYTSLVALERIIKSEEIWFSNPLVMNDLEEVRFGISRGVEIFLQSESVVRACETEDRYRKLRDAFVWCYRRFEEEYALDTYVFCLSEHDPDDRDGLLSMWRGYGGNGTGAAVVFDTGKVALVETSPLIIARVEYASTEMRREWLVKLVARFARILADVAPPDDKLFLAASSLFDRIKTFAIFSKHEGFREEREWRVVYLPDRDVGNKLSSMFHYSLGERGAELKLRYKIAPIDGISGPDLSLAHLVERIILGPSITSALAQKAVVRMLEKHGQGALADRVMASSIPFRPTGMIRF